MTQDRQKPDHKGHWVLYVQSGRDSEGSGQLLKGFRPLPFLLCTLRSPGIALLCLLSPPQALCIPGVNVLELMYLITHSWCPISDDIKSRFGS